MKSIFLRKIVWAFDALEEPENQKNSLFLLGALSRATSAKIDPVYILSPPYADVGSNAPTDLEQAFAALGEKRLLETKQKSDIVSMSSGKVLVSHDGSIRKQVVALIDYAKAQEADAIVVGTHARSGAARFFLGSFAETISIYSDIPIFSVNPRAKVREKISKILMPTTFYPRFRPDFERAVDLAKTLEATLTLFYKEPVMVGTNMMNPSIYRFIEQDMADRRETAKEWQGWAKQFGVETELHIDNHAGYLVPTLEEFAKAGNFDLIAMGTQADSVSAIMIGSAARQMIRHAPCPVWTIRTEDQN